MQSQPAFLKGLLPANGESNNASPFSVMVRKEVADQVRSWRFIILAGLILVTFLGSLYVSLTNIGRATANPQDPDRLFLYLKLLTITDGSLPPFHVFIGFLGPLLGIALGFDAINSEQSNGTLIRLMAQPIYRDSLLNAKFTASLIVVSILFFSLSLLMIGGGLITTGVKMEPSEFIRIMCFTALSVIYIAFWLNLSILLSVKFRQTATSALTAIAIWLFFTVFYQILLRIVVSAFLPDPGTLSQEQVASYNGAIITIMRLVPSQLYTDATTTLLMPSVRSLGPLTMEQMAGAIPSPLSIRESLLVVWPQVSGLIAATVVCFALSYYLFMRREIRT
ncbi:ABC-2 type transport system permease protein [Chitinophaga rupis]|uniref:ABC-2 type transport system permease protein n=1 Tax=Chitinophaga rupis TaxID=573321 RepID=A0A1H7QZZ2_9BACT|nr:ABC transporter permease subunit [Chitinophaga rupis]SEL53513.1 ABC-2 type transport system permease protein [Chitinophaga rupis]